VRAQAGASAYIWKVACHSREGGNPVLSNSFLFLEVFSGVDTWYSYLIKVVAKLKIIGQGKLACQSMVRFLRYKRQRGAFK